MRIKSLSYAHIIAIADLWRDIGGIPNVEIGALEPLLWLDGQYRIHDIVSTLTERGFRVSLTTNGQLLDIFVKNLSRAGLSLIRTSWHSTSPLMFKEVSGGYGEYTRFMYGVTLALESGIKIAFNRVLFKGFTDDLPKQLEFIERHKSRLKLYTLMWTPQNDATYKKFYQEWHSIVRKSVLPRTAEITKVRKQIGRTRLRFHLIGGGMVEVKLGDMLNRSKEPCFSCAFKARCEEKFGDYIRIDPSLHLYFCYMRRDIGFPIQEYFGRPDELKQRMEEVFGINSEHLVTTAQLRITVTPFCNFNCRVPGASHGWCMEEPGKYRYPKIQPSLLG